MSEERLKLLENIYEQAKLHKTNMPDIVENKYTK